MTEMKYRRIVVGDHGGPEVMQVSEEAAPRPDAGEVRIRVLAAGVSALDLMVRRSGFPGFPKVPFTPGVDVVGLIDEIGPGVSSVAPGRRVGVLLGDQGGYAEMLCVPADHVVPIPDGVDDAAAVCVIANYLTAENMLHRAAAVESGERILIQGAAGGVGTALLELGGLAGLEMYGTASEYNHELVRSMGATPIDYRNEDFVTRIKSLTGDGVDAVFDPIGGARQLWRSYRALRKGGRLVWFGVAGAARAGLRVIPLSLSTRLLLSLLPDGRKAPMPPDGMKPIGWYRENLAKLFDYLAGGKIRPLVADRIPLVEAARAHEILERGGYAGKVVLLADAAPPPASTD
jgi:NADPH:quinone reductase-like Zn-dependent oxidoreductase